jgi:uncharacterized tellurite resistance protein B-like protein
MSIISRLRDILQDFTLQDLTLPDLTGAGATDRDGEARLTVAALLVLVARVDGRVLDVETEGLRMLLRSRCGLSEDEAKRALDQVDDTDADVDRAASFANRIMQEVGPADRPKLLELLAMAYRLATIDGHLHDFEDDLIWRIGRLLGLSDDEVARTRAEALANAAAETGHGE